MPEFLLGHDIKAVYDEQWALLPETPRRIQAARDLLAGRIKAPIDASIMPGEQDREQLRVSLSQKYTMALKLMAKLLAKAPEPTRLMDGSAGLTAERHATQIERAAKAGMDQLYPRDVVIDNLLNEGECAVKVVPAMAHWDGIPTLHRDGDPEQGIKSTYQVDSRGRKADDPWYRDAEKRRAFKPDDAASARYFKQRESDYRARHIPVSMEAISRLNGIPINPRRVGQRYEIDGFVERRSFQTSELLRRGYRWGESEQLIEGDRRHATVELYSYYGFGPKGSPYVAYCVDGLKTTKDYGEGYTEAVIDLGKEYGLSRLPIVYDYGWSFPGASNADDRGVPFVSPFGRSWLNLDSLLTMLMTRAWRAANLFLMYKPDPLVLKSLNVSDKAPMPQLQANTIMPVLGDLMDMPNLTIPEVGEVLALLGQSLQGEMPSPAAFGGSNASGYARNVAEADTLGVFEQVQRADTSLYAQAASLWLEQAARIGERRGNVWVFVPEDIVTETGRKSVRGKLEIDPGLFDNDFEVSAEYPTEIGDNMALTQQLMEAHQRGEIPQEIVLEKGFGFSNPDEIIAKNEAEKARNTPLGQAKLMEWAARIAGDEEEAAIMEALAQQELLKILPTGPNQQANVIPAGAATAGVPDPMGPQGAASLTGMGGAGPAQQSLAGIIGGAMQTGPQAQAGVIENGA